MLLHTYPNDFAVIPAGREPRQSLISPGGLIPWPFPAPDFRAGAVLVEHESHDPLLLLRPVSWSRV